jgi:hypothetical protein
MRKIVAIAAGVHYLIQLNCVASSSIRKFSIWGDRIPRGGGYDVDGKDDLFSHNSQVGKVEHGSLEDTDDNDVKNGSGQKRMKLLYLFKSERDQQIINHADKIRPPRNEERIMASLSSWETNLNNLNEGRKDIEELHSLLSTMHERMQTYIADLGILDEEHDELERTRSFTPPHPKKLLHKIAPKIPAIKRSPVIMLRITSARGDVDVKAAARGIGLVAAAVELYNYACKKLDCIDQPASTKICKDRRFEQLVECILCGLDKEEYSPTYTQDQSEEIGIDEDHTDYTDSKDDGRKAQQYGLDVHDIATIAWGLSVLNIKQLPHVSDVKPEDIFAKLSARASKMIIERANTIHNGEFDGEGIDKRALFSKKMFSLSKDIYSLISAFGDANRKCGVQSDKLCQTCLELLCLSEEKIWNKRPRHQDREIDDLVERLHKSETDEKDDDQHRKEEKTSVVSNDDIPIDITQQKTSLSQTPLHKQQTQSDSGGIEFNEPVYVFSHLSTSNLVSIFSTLVDHKDLSRSKYFTVLLKEINSRLKHDLDVTNTFDIGEDKTMPDPNLETNTKELLEVIDAAALLSGEDEIMIGPNSESDTKELEVEELEVIDAAVLLSVEDETMIDPNSESDTTELEEIDAAVLLSSGGHKIKENERFTVTSQTDVEHEWRNIEFIVATELSSIVSEVASIDEIQLTSLLNEANLSNHGYVMIPIPLGLTFVSQDRIDIHSYLIDIDSTKLALLDLDLCSKMRHERSSQRLVDDTQKANKQEVYAPQLLFSIYDLAQLLSAANSLSNDHGFILLENSLKVLYQTGIERIDNLEIQEVPFMFSGSSNHIDFLIASGDYDDLLVATMRWVKSERFLTQLSKLYCSQTFPLSHTNKFLVSLSTLQSGLQWLIPEGIDNDHIQSFTATVLSNAKQGIGHHSIDDLTQLACSFLEFNCLESVPLISIEDLGEILCTIATSSDESKFTEETNNFGDKGPPPSVFDMLASSLNNFFMCNIKIGSINQESANNLRCLNDVPVSLFQKHVEIELFSPSAILKLVRGIGRSVFFHVEDILTEQFRICLLPFIVFGVCII